MSYVTTRRFLGDVLPNFVASGKHGTQPGQLQILRLGPSVNSRAEERYMLRHCVMVWEAVRAHANGHCVVVGRAQRWARGGGCAKPPLWQYRQSPEGSPACSAAAKGVVRQIDNTTRHLVRSRVWSTRAVRDGLVFADLRGFMHGEEGAVECQRQCQHLRKFTRDLNITCWVMAR
jgi:hypothetical protein